jgi:hypothetical protein
VIGHDRGDVVAEKVGLTLHHGNQGDAEGIQAPAHDQQIDRVSAKAIDLVEPDLLEAMSGGVCQEPSTVGSLGQRDCARYSVVDVATHEFDSGLARQVAGDLVGLGSDRLALALVLGADPLVGRDPPDACDRGHRVAPRPRPGRCPGRPNTTRSAAAMALRSRWAWGARSRVAGSRLVRAGRGCGFIVGASGASCSPT